MVKISQPEDGLAWDEALTACRSSSTGGPMADLASFHNDEDTGIQEHIL